MNLTKEQQADLKAGKPVTIGKHMLVPLDHNPHEAREDGFHPARIGAKKAPDGQWYVKDKDSDGKYLKVRHEHD